MEEIYVNVDSLKSVQPRPEERRPGEPVQPARDVNDCFVCSVLISSVLRLQELWGQPQQVCSSLSGPADPGSAHRTRGHQRLL